MLKDMTERNTPLGVCCIFIPGGRSDHRGPASARVCAENLGQQQGAYRRKVPPPGLGCLCFIISFSPLSRAAGSTSQRDAII